MLTDDAVFRIGNYEFGHNRGKLRTFGWDLGDYDSYHGEITYNGLNFFGYVQDKPPTWTLKLRTLTNIPGQPLGNTELAQNELAKFYAAWRPTLGAGTDIALRYKLAGRWRRVYGRPGKITKPSTNYLVDTGRADVTAEFHCSDSNTYAETPKSVVTTLAPSVTGGILPGMAPPWYWASGTTATARTVAVGGDTAAPFTITFTGPVTDPVATVGGLQIALIGTLAYDVSVNIDTRRRRIMYGGARSGSAAAMLAPHTRLKDLTLEPGSHSLQFKGIDETGSATCEIVWRDTYLGI